MYELTPKVSETINTKHTNHLGSFEDDKTSINNVSVAALSRDTRFDRNGTWVAQLELVNWSPRAFKLLRCRAFFNDFDAPTEFSIEGPIDQWTIYQLNQTLQRVTEATPKLLRIEVVLPNPRFNLDLIRYESRGNETNGKLWYFSSFRKQVFARTLGDMKVSTQTRTQTHNIPRLLIKQLQVVMNSPEASLYWLYLQNDTGANYGFDHILSEHHTRVAMILNPKSPYEGLGKH